MLSFKDFLKEEFIIEEAGASADSKGKLRELNLGKHLNNGKHMESYRVEGKTPKEVAHKHNESTHGKNYEKSENYKESEKNSKRDAQHIKDHLKKFGHGEVKKTVWASQPSDHKSETSVEDKNNSADLIVATNRSHQRPHGKETKVAVSIKTGSSKVNYSNPGITALESRSGSNLKKHIKAHEELTNSLLPKSAGNAHDRYKQLRDSTKKADKDKAAKIKQSSLELNKNVSKEFRKGIAKKSHEELMSAIKDEVAPKTHLKHIVSREVTDTAGKTKAHKTYDLHKHVDEYLNHFKDLSVDKKSESTSVTVHGTFHHPKDRNHPLNGKKMAVANWTISAGGKPANASPRGAVNLSSEDHKDIHYTDKSEHMDHKVN